MNLLRCAAALVFLGTVLAPAAAQQAAPITWEARAELDLTLGATLVPNLPPVYQWWLVGHVELRAASGSTAFNLTLDPGVLYDVSTQSVWGLTEAYLHVRRDRLDLTAGVERLPLEVARLTLPYSIEPVNVLGTRGGVGGARALWYPNDSTRVRAALLDDQGRVAPLLSLRREFGSLEVEATVLWQGGRSVAGVGGSGLLRDLVVYGEVWRLDAPEEWRYAVGISGSITDGFWTVETGYASSIPGAPPRHQLAAQVAGRVGEDYSATLTARWFDDSDADRGQVTLELVQSVGDREYTVTLAALVGPEPVQVILTAGVRVFW